jgi:hypothetical protein
MNLTPLHISIALHYHTRSDQFELVTMSSVRRQYALDLVAAGLLEVQHDHQGHVTGFYRTDGLAVWVEALCATPFPVKRWVMPAAA